MKLIPQKKLELPHTVKGKLLGCNSAYRDYSAVTIRRSGCPFGNGGKRGLKGNCFIGDEKYPAGKSYLTIYGKVYRYVNPSWSMGRI